MRLEFLVRRADGSFRRLRSVRARVRRDDTVAWRHWALKVGLVPDPEDLADLIAREDDDGTDESDAADARTRADDRTQSDSDMSGSGPRPARYGLPEALLGKVRALLRKGESPAATEDEARVVHADQGQVCLALAGGFGDQPSSRAVKTPAFRQTRKRP